MTAIFAFAECRFQERFPDEIQVRPRVDLERVLLAELFLLQLRHRFLNWRRPQVPDRVRAVRRRREDLDRFFVRHFFPDAVFRRLQTGWNPLEFS